MNTLAVPTGHDPARRGVTRQLRRWLAPVRAIAVVVSLLLHGTGSAVELVERRVHELLDWIETSTEQDVGIVRRALPSVILAAPGEEIRFGDYSLLVAPEMGGVWDTEFRLIVLVEPWEVSDPIDLSILLHELVHAVQSAEGRSVCDPEAEWEAYALQARWLAERNIVMFVDWNEVWEHALCEDDVAP